MLTGWLAGWLTESTNQLGWVCQGEDGRLKPERSSYTSVWFLIVQAQPSSIDRGARTLNSNGSVLQSPERRHTRCRTVHNRTYSPVQSAQERSSQCQCQCSRQSTGIQRSASANIVYQNAGKAQSAGAAYIPRTKIPHIKPLDVFGKEIQHMRIQRSTT